jgi:hypothetical protein
MALAPGLIMAMLRSQRFTLKCEMSVVTTREVVETCREGFGFAVVSAVTKLSEGSKDCRLENHKRLISR